MEDHVEPLSAHLHDFAVDRERLLGFCHRLTGDVGWAEDLAQETLLRAWRHAEQLQHPERRDAWLKAIARNLYRRSFRDRRLSPLPLESDDAGDGSVGHDVPADDADVEVELDRQDLATLLDRAMAYLPAETRQILVERFVRETPLAETAARLGLSEGAVTMRLQRGKLALRRVLVTAFPGDLEAYGLGDRGDGPTWRGTPIWCPDCGQHRLEGICVRDLGLFRLRCPVCGELNNSWCVKLFASARAHRTALANLLDWSNRLYHHSFDHLTATCHGCGRTVHLRKDLSGDQPCLSYYCSRCHAGTWNRQGHNLLGLPEVRRFWRDHPRMHRLPNREVESRGHSAVVAGFASRSGLDRVEVVYARDSLRVLSVHRSGRPA